MAIDEIKIRLTAFWVLLLALGYIGSAVGTALAIVLALFAALESLVGFCAGCYVYDFFKRFSR